MIHKELAAGRWFELTLMEQLGNIGSEISRAIKWRGRDEQNFMGAIERCLDLFDLTLSDPRWKGRRRREIARAREVLCDIVYGESQYSTTLEDLDRYFTSFALIARNRTLAEREAKRRAARKRTRSASGESPGPKRQS
ncbi:MAG: hypothetical protein R6V58_09300 [Planctomycetota bacterium]